MAGKQEFHMLRLVMIAATAAAVAAPAVAQDADDRFDGPFIGGQLGWQLDRQTLTVDGARASNSPSGLSYGGQLGYDARVGENGVIGFEGSLTGRTGSTSFEDFDLRQGRTFTATARMGYLVTDSSLVYARGGWANARFVVNADGETAAQNRQGFTIGAGYERYVADNISARIEYNYSDFGSDNLSAVLDADSRLSFTRHALTAGVNVRF
jgi:outer membrane immunogenic protein